MSIGAVYRRELLSFARRGGEPWWRSVFAGILLAVVLAVFASIYGKAEVASIRLMTEIADRAFAIVVAVHVIPLLDLAVKSSRCIAEEADRRTLDFLLSTQLSNAEIVVGKLAACLTAFLGTVASGLPIVLLLHRLGGVDWHLILLSYAVMGSMGLFLSSLSVWASATAPDVRNATSRSVLWICGWLWLPFAVAFMLPRIGLRPPVWVSSANAWLLSSSPMGLFVVWRGLGGWPSLRSAVGRMCELQLAFGLVCLIAAILQLRSSYRSRVGGPSQEEAARTGFLRGRHRPRPEVGDDPILWRERYTGRPSGFVRVLNLLISLTLAGMIAYPTFFYGRLALIELWNHGYLAGSTGGETPEFNIIVRFFIASTSNHPADEARMDFNFFLRYVTVALTYFLAMFACGSAVDGIGGERGRETWGSLLATPLSAREILRSKMLASLRKLRAGLATVVVLWALGLAAGAIHPLGFALSMMCLAAMIWFYLAWGMRCAVVAANPASAASKGVGSTLLLTTSGGLPFLLPAKFSSVLLGAGSSPFVIGLAQLSYRDVRNATAHGAYPFLRWIGLNTGESAFLVVLTCLVGILVPAVGGSYCWRYTVRHFDRMVGRPWRGARRGAAPNSNIIISHGHTIINVLRPARAISTEPGAEASQAGLT
jgi:ABC-type transport system involved in multi-copper enzyme maturation permease subunit